MKSNIVQRKYTMGLKDHINIPTIIVGILLILGRGSRMRDPCVYTWSFGPLYTTAVQQGLDRGLLISGSPGS